MRLAARARSYGRYGTRWRRHPVHGFIALPLWTYVALGAFVCLAFAGLQTHRLKAIKAEYATFVAQVKAKGEEQERRTKETIAANLKAKESADAQNVRLRSANTALANGLRDARSSRGFLPAASAGAANPGLACYDRAELERALQLFDAGVTRLISEGDSALIDLNTARDWSQAR